MDVTSNTDLLHQDIAKEKLFSSTPIDWVGMKGLQIPVPIDDIHTPAKFSIFVSLDDTSVRGIHMSRINSALHEHFKNNKLNLISLEELLDKCISDQQGISNSGKLQVEFLQPVKRNALKSDKQSWRMYPVFMELSKTQNETCNYTIGSTVTYSSTCPCSAFLSREVTAEAFKKDFPEENLTSKKDVLNWIKTKSSTATPHAQKSTADFKLKLSSKLAKDMHVLDYINEVEKLLGTAVQMIVKRIDEAEFARLNGSNLMFCEDAIRRLIPFFNKDKNILDYIITVQHYESLHPFTVQSSASKGIAGGWRA